MTCPDALRAAVQREIVQRLGTVRRELANLATGARGAAFIDAGAEIDSLESDLFWVERKLAVVEIDPPTVRDLSRCA